MEQASVSSTNSFLVGFTLTSALIVDQGEVPAKATNVI